MTPPPLFEAQKNYVDFALSKTPRRIFNTSDPGTGKTRASLEVWHASPERKRVLVVAPLSILKAAWQNDAQKFYTDAFTAVAHGSPVKRLQAFRSIANVVLINHDGIKWVADEVKAGRLKLDDFSDLIIDEFTKFKHQNTGRSKALLTVARAIPNVQLLGGTPNSNEVTDIWYPAFCLDDGKRLGPSFFRFRMQVADSKQVGPKPNMVKWTERAGAREWIADLLSDINYRVTLEECVDMPPHIVTTIPIQMPAEVMRAYEQMQKTSVAFLGDGIVDAVHAGSRAKKLLQILSGAVYNSDGEAVKVYNDRYELVMDLVEQRDRCIIVFNYKHERDGLLAEAAKRGLRFGVVDGDCPVPKRHELTDQLQRGDLDGIIVHPRSGAHGFTWTRATTTIHCGPTPDAEDYTQVNARIYRAGQTERTETIRIAAEGTYEEAVYNSLDSKLFSMTDLLAMLCASTKARIGD
jgi:SNF2 family DNA or RNA helicase